MVYAADMSDMHSDVMWPDIPMLCAWNNESMRWGEDDNMPATSYDAKSEGYKNRTSIFPYKLKYIILLIIDTTGCTYTSI